MSTKARRRARGSILIAGAWALAGCAATPPGAPVSHFSQIGFHAATAPAPPPEAQAGVRPAPPSLRSRLPAPETTGGVAPASLDEARSRIAVYLERAGFALEMRPEDGGVLISGTRMATPGAVAGQATCALEAMRRPDFSSTELTVRLTPAPGGVQVQTSARFVLVDTKIISRDLARQTCRSDGALESTVRTVAAGG